MMQRRWVSFGFIGAILLLAAAPAYAAGWVVCGTLSQFETDKCTLPGYPPAQYEYAIVDLTDEPIRVMCSYWNHGARVYNVSPFFVNADNPTVDQYWGGFAYYRGTQSPGDNCPGGGWVHKYWFFYDGGKIGMPGGRGCLNPQVWCRAR
ncbi:hypothetical protein HUA76_41725 [Myxococcus sp. CA056]|uniref:hypothetical protein n=1 Tax=unclassified Myxococcus TaxID=2648731 RepID=UPI00157A2FB5|nr:MULTISPECIES: hypothetical protein [unclassified Myxococcus]NTX17309.1 hypothetical protein [Myxococcus sp. CA056]NTX40249.1 hypothetical protein [Myxococcus sp. CA033]NTX51253.1 hypothetical protein [Myxococcus sp. CA039A]